LILYREEKKIEETTRSAIRRNRLNNKEKNTHGVVVNNINKEVKK